MPRLSSVEKARNEWKAKDEKVRGYFPLLPELLKKISSPEPALAYCFQRLEMGQRVSLYVLLMREYRTNSELAWLAVDNLDITRANFPEFYKLISGKKFPEALKAIIEPAEEVRDHITHGRSKTAAQINEAICRCLKYAEAMNLEFQKKAGFSPFGSLRGVTSSRSRPQLTKKISRVVLKGLGFELS